MNSKELVGRWLVECTDGRCHKDTIAILESYTNWLNASQDARIEALEGDRDALRIERDKFAASLIEHNEIVRSAISVGERDGKQTNWPAFRRRCSKIANDHHGRVNQAKAALGGEHGG